MLISHETWAKAHYLYLENPDTGEELYHIAGILRGRLMYFLAEYNSNKKPVRLILTDEYHDVIHDEVIPPVNGKFGPGVIIKKGKIYG